MNANIQIKRIYEPISPADGCRVLVDRLWPRGIKREVAAIDYWLKDLGPSHELRKWFGHRPERWDDFVQRYRSELSDLKAQQLLQELIDLAAADPLTLLYSAKDTEHNQAVVIAQAIEEAASSMI